MINLAKKYPFVSYGILCIGSGASILVLASLASYDDGGFGLVAVVLALGWAVVAFPFSIPMELLGLVMPPVPSGLASAVIGISLCALADYSYGRRRSAPN